MNTSANLLILEAGGACNVLEIEELTSKEKPHAEEIVVITGKITVSP